MKVAEFLRDFEDVAGLETGCLQQGLNIKEIKGWDSMTALMFISYVEEHFGIVVEGSQIASAVKLQNLLDLLGDKLE